MSLPDEIRKFVINRYILPARDRNEELVTLSADNIHQGLDFEVPVERICKALDTRLFLDTAIVSLVQRQGSLKGADAQWVFDVSMRHQRGEVLVAIVKDKRDMKILKEEGWYRIPVKTAPKRWPPKWIALYQGAKWGEERGINYYAPVQEIRKVSRHELFPNEKSSAKSNKEYFQIFADSLQQIDPPIMSRRPRVIIFIPTTWAKFTVAQEINDLYDNSPLEDLLWTELKNHDIPAERQWRVQLKRKRYYLDFALFCREGKIDIETDGDSWHVGRSQSIADNKRQNDLTTLGWHILRFNTRQIREEMSDYCVPQVKKAINQYRGIVGEGTIPRKYHDLPEGDYQQLALFEAPAEYDLD